jgi:hypothetical protein
MIPADKIKHLQAGALVAAVLIAMWQVEAWVMPDRVALYPWLFATMNGAVCVHVAKEVEDHMDNLINPGMHEVSVYDALAGTIGSALLVALFAYLIG